MNDKPVAGLVTFAMVAPVVALCCLGPVVLGSVLGGVVSWFAGLGPAEVAAGALAMGLAAYGSLRWQRARFPQADAQTHAPGQGRHGLPSGPKR